MPNQTRLSQVYRTRMPPFVSHPSIWRSHIEGEHSLFFTRESARGLLGRDSTCAGYPGGVSFPVCAFIFWAVLWGSCMSQSLSAFSGRFGLAAFRDLGLCVQWTTMYMLTAMARLCTHRTFWKSGSLFPDTLSHLAGRESQDCRLACGTGSGKKNIVNLRSPQSLPPPPGPAS